MGFSTVAAQILFFIAVVGISAGIIATFGFYVDESKSAMSDKQNYVIGQLRTDVAITNIDNSSGHLYIYAKNVGKQQLQTDCVELYVDSAWANLTSATIVDPTTGSPLTTWDIEETVKLKPTSAPLNAGSVHEARLITCNGVSDTENF
jgi:archaellum component FlaG (FlaF/FlaG flagellin family)